MTSEPILSEQLDQMIMAAHAAHDTWLLCELYKQAADIKLNSGDGDAAGFLLTQSYVYGLDAGHPEAASIRKRLAQDGREFNE